MLKHVYIFVVISLYEFDNATDFTYYRRERPKIND